MRARSTAVLSSYLYQPKTKMLDFFCGYMIFVSSTTGIKCHSSQNDLNCTCGKGIFSFPAARASKYRMEARKTNLKMCPPSMFCEVTRCSHWHITKKSNRVITATKIKKVTLL